MKNVCIICEYNPFHKGHRYMIRQLKEMYGFDNCICIMSGNFVQRGEPAIMDKYSRAHEALKGGADLVIELPALFATSSAREFAKCGVALAKGIGISDALAFGVEPGMTIEALTELPSTGSDAVKENLKRGMTYPEAVSEAFGLEISGPNTILASEYLKSLKGTGIEPVLIERSGDAYSSAFHEGDGFASATAIRCLLQNGNFYEASMLSGTPEEVFSNNVLTFTDALSPLLSEKLLAGNDFSSFLDVSREINDRLINRKNLIMSYSDRIRDTKTRQYTRSRISRALLHIALGMTKADFEEQKSEGYAAYVRVLGYREGTGLLNQIKKQSDLPIYSKAAAFAKDYPGEIFYDQVYYSLTSQKSEYLRSPVII